MPGESGNSLALKEEENASRVASGFHAGERFVPPKRGKATMRPRSSEYIMISQPFLPMALKASRELSGEMRGEREIVPELVTWRWFAPS